MKAIPKMSDPGELKNLAVFVERSKSGHFCWVIHAQSHQTRTHWDDLEKSARSFDTWIEAFDDGNIGLVKFLLRYPLVR